MTALRKIRLLLVDDHPLTREGVKACLAHVPGLTVVGEAADGDEAIARAHELRPDVVVMDLNMPRLNGLAATARLMREQPDARVLILTMHDHAEFLVEIIRAGARGCLSKAQPPSDLVRAIEQVAAGETHFALDETVRFLRRYHPAPPCALAEPVHALTDREQEVIGLIGQGLTNREIAVRLQVAIRTVETHRERLMRKLDLHDASQLRAYACAQALVSAGSLPATASEMYPTAI